MYSRLQQKKRAHLANSLPAGTDWLWHGTDVLAERGRKSAAVIAAVSRVLESEPPPGLDVAQFVSNYRYFDNCASSTREWLTSEPYAYFWGRLAYELLRAVLHPNSRISGLAGQYCRTKDLAPLEALARHLPHFTRFSVAAALLDNVELELDEPFQVTGPFALPGTPLCLDSSGPVLIHGVYGGQLRLSESIADAYPVLEYEGCRCRLQPAVFNVPVNGIAPEVWCASKALQKEHVGDIEQALALLHSLDEEGFEQIRKSLRIIALRSQGKPGTLSNVSHCDLPGAISISVNPYPYEMANIIRHEFLHNRLFALEEAGWFLDQGSGEQLYSPWRSGPRPAHGVLHAVYVFTGIGRYWLAVVQNSETPQSVCELARTRILRGLYQVRIGLSMLRREARFTARGEQLISALEGEHESLWQAARSIDINADLQDIKFRDGTRFDVEVHEDTVLQGMKKHLNRYGTTEQIEQLTPLLAG